ncbi:hypothetical protein [Rufibacter quisquiliarum]|uniref:Uncharacterized protein n=1 Tax=Rufibacter quisquiliarum TaxID=1549639 RepID=A0A839G8L9_9BACT|nr:hypothetical protein [Rufibacter quisquiliarum]MBA9075784.1 hypothetical protein [Rufibacter quisquiliarum]
MTTSGRARSAFAFKGRKIPRLLLLGQPAYPFYLTVVRFAPGFSGFRQEKGRFFLIALPRGQEPCIFVSPSKAKAPGSFSAGFFPTALPGLHYLGLV